MSQPALIVHIETIFDWHRLSGREEGSASAVALPPPTPRHQGTRNMGSHEIETSKYLPVMQF